MREVHVTASEFRANEVESVLEDHGIDFTEVPNTVDGSLFMFALPTAAVDEVLTELHEAGVHEESYVVTTKVEMSQSPQFPALYERYAGTVRKLPKPELHAKIRELQWPRAIYYAGTILSVLAAAAGLLLDQSALIIGSMVIAPQASSALAAPAGVLLDDWEMFVVSVKEQSLGLAVSIVMATLFGWLVRLLGFGPPVLSLTQLELVGVRLSPSLLSTVGAVVAGVVGAFGYTTEGSTVLVGVMIAAAIIPAAAATGLALAWGTPLLAVGALLLLLVNIIAINVAAFPTLVAMGYVPTWWGEGSSLRTAVPADRRTAVAVVVAALAVTVLVTGGLTATNVAYDRSVNQAVQTTLEEPRYGALSLAGVQPEYGGALAPTESSSVTVQVRRPEGQTYPALAGTLERRIERRTDRDVRVTVEFTDSQSSSQQSASRASHDPVRGEVAGAGA